MPPADSPSDAVSVGRARCDALDIGTFYAILRLRVDVFVVEQQCPYPELDGLDTRPDTEHWWVEVDSVVVATLRVLNPAGRPRIGRVATASTARGRGHAATAMRAALESLDAERAPEVTLEAQAHLVQWYGSFGFVPTGHTYLEDGIPHVSMLRRSRRGSHHDQDRGGGQHNGGDGQLGSHHHGQ